MTKESQEKFTKKLKKYSELVFNDLQKAKENWVPKNIGYAFVFSEDLKAIDSYIKKSQKIEVAEHNRVKMPETYQTKLQCKNWVFKSAFHWNDINWNELNPKPLISCRKTFILCLILALLSLFLVTPLMVYKNLLGGMEESESQSSIIRMFGEFLPLLILLLVNVVIIPFFVDMAAMLMDNETKSSMQKKIMYMNLILMHINMLILPLAGLITYEEIITFIKEQAFE